MGTGVCKKTVILLLAFAALAVPSLATTATARWDTMTYGEWLEAMDTDQVWARGIAGGVMHGVFVLDGVWASTTKGSAINCRAPISPGMVIATLQGKPALTKKDDPLAMAVYAAMQQLGCKREPVK